MRWSPPLAPSLKFNVDGAIFAELHSMGVGVIARGWNGIHAPLGPLEAESKAVEVGLQFAK